MSEDKRNLTKNEVRYLLKKIDRKVKDITPDTEVGGLPNDLIQDVDNLPLILSGIDSKINALGGLSTQEIIRQLEQQKENAGQRKIRYNRLKDALEHPEIEGILNIYADEATTEDVNGEIFHVIHPDSEVQNVVEDMLNRLGIFDKSWGIIRNMCAFGDELYEVIISRSARRILKIVQLQREFIRRIEFNGDLVGFSLLDDDAYTSSMDVNTNGFYLRQVNYNTEKEKEDKIIYPFRILHFKIPSAKYGVYGQAVIDTVLSSIEQLSMMEKSLLIARVTRSPERRIFKINIGNLTGEQAIRYTRQVMDNFRNRKRLDLYTKKDVDYQKDIFGNTEDIAIPVRAGDTGNAIDTLPQLNNPGDVNDLEFIRDKIFPGVGIPRQYLFDDQFANANTNLSSKSIPFAKKIRRIQRYFIYQLYKLAFIELKLQGYKNDTIRDLVIIMNNPSNLDEKEYVEIENARWTLVQTIKQQSTETIFYPDYLLYKNVLKLNDAEIVQLMKLCQLQAQGKNVFMAFPEEDRPEGAEDLLEQPPMAPPGQEGGGGGGGGAMPPMGPEGGAGPEMPPAEGESEGEMPPAEGEAQEPGVPTAVVKKLGPAPENADVQIETDPTTRGYLEAQGKKKQFLDKLQSRNKKEIITFVEETKQLQKFKEEQPFKSMFSYEEFLINGELNGLEQTIDPEVKNAQVIY